MLVASADAVKLSDSVASTRVIWKFVVSDTVKLSERSLSADRVAVAASALVKLSVTVTASAEIADSAPVTITDSVSTCRLVASADCTPSVGKVSEMSPLVVFADY